jgi:hypothetical protein
MMIWHHNQRLVDGKWVYQREEPFRMGHYVAFSPDGLRWREIPKPVFPYDPVRDTASTMWDPRTGTFVAFVKQQVAGKRARFLSESKDFLNWPAPVRMPAADAQDPPSIELYNNTGFYLRGHVSGTADRVSSGAEGQYLSGHSTDLQPRRPRVGARGRPLADHSRGPQERGLGLRNEYSFLGAAGSSRR